LRVCFFGASKSHTGSGFCRVIIARLSLNYCSVTVVGSRSCHRYCRSSFYWRHWIQSINFWMQSSPI